ncbi:MAG: hypothetical protein HC836_31045 [Richelia sp. RM2_1_2]|nr:hypothetical protein [Richelia sp. SM2_1_7]NJM20409.1 hypothetical protein [Richelia sp. SM1_7_0]NJN09781.1 hypothetical protein [Richelia sp. RM1_1_1]NJO28709.1 hypothetical protein [Richelia sp. SL_2_1]NJO62505.1 hypothetical protein [Richelia sp. RM2_1_2]
MAHSTVGGCKPNWLTQPQVDVKAIAKFQFCGLLNREASSQNLGQT